MRLGCPKCPQTYHSPEFLNEHYRHLHLKDIETDENIEVVQPDYNDHEGSGVTCTQQLENGGRTTLRNVPGKFYRLRVVLVVGIYQFSR